MYNVNSSRKIKNYLKPTVSAVALVFIVSCQQNYGVGIDTYPVPASSKPEGVVSNASSSTPVSGVTQGPDSNSGDSNSGTPATNNPPPSGNPSTPPNDVVTNPPSGNPSTPPNDVVTNPPSGNPSTPPNDVVVNPPTSNPSTPPNDGVVTPPKPFVSSLVTINDPIVDHKNASALVTGHIEKNDSVITGIQCLIGPSLNTLLNSVPCTIGSDGNFSIVLNGQNVGQTYIQVSAINSNGGIDASKTSSFELLPYAGGFDPGASSGNIQGTLTYATDPVLAKKRRLDFYFDYSAEGTFLGIRQSPELSSVPYAVSMDNFNVGTRSFTSGFSDGSGNQLKYPDGSVMTEYFAFNFTTKLKLSSSNSEGLYQLAIISDDGAFLEYFNAATQSWIRVIDNNYDNGHSAQMDCSQTYFDMNQLSKLPIRMQYYQGPKEEISLDLLWRKVPDICRTDSSDPRCHSATCGQRGTDYKYYYSQPNSKLLKAFVLNEWTVLNNNNYTK